RHARTRSAHAATTFVFGAPARDDDTSAGATGDLLKAKNINRHQLRRRPRTRTQISYYDISIPPPRHASVRRVGRFPPAPPPAALSAAPAATRSAARRARRETPAKNGTDRPCRRAPPRPARARRFRADKRRRGTFFDGADTGAASRRG